MILSLFWSSSVSQLIEQVREMAGHRTPHCQSEQHSMSRLLKLLLATSQDMTYGDNHLDRAREMLDRMADHETPSYLSRQPSASRLFDSFLMSRLMSQHTLACRLIQSQWRSSQLCQLCYTSP